jgi:multidrug efflux pump subunit AcrA (membrane-fusion protein)
MEIEVPNPGFRLKPGMYARVQLTIGTKPDALTVPRNAVVDVEGKSGVFIAVAGGGRQGGGTGNGPAGRGQGGERRAENAQPRPPASGGAPSNDAAALTARFIPVETGIRDEDRVEIIGGLNDGARVITTGAGALKDGDRIVAATPEGGGRRGRAADAGAPGRDNPGSTR